VINPRQRASDQFKNVTTTEQATNLPKPDSSENTSLPASDDLQSIFGDALVGIDKDGKINFINKTACKLTGWLQSEAKNRFFGKIFQLSGNSSDALNLKLVNYIIESGHHIAPMTQQVIKTKNNKEIIIDFSISPLDANSAILMFHQAEQKNGKEKRTLLYQVNHDPLTRLSNREALQNIINNLHHSYKRKGGSYSVLLLDLDRFKLINDCYSHATGDQLLQLVAERIQFFIRDKDNIGRWAGEEFLCVLPDTNPDTASLVAERLRKNISQQAFKLAEHEIFITASIGIASFPVDGNTPEKLFCTADATLYEAKSAGRNRVHKSQESGINKGIFSVGTRLEDALNNQRVLSVYQPIINIQTGEQAAEETLARIKEKNGSLTEAGKFIDAAIKLQLVHRIDYKVIRETISRCCVNYTKNNLNFPLFVNISADLLRRPELVKDIINFAQKEFKVYGLEKLEKKPLVIEITEQELLHDVEEVKNLLAPFINFGFALAIDDFGSGYSSLTYLADLPVSYLKFDGALIKRVAVEDRARKIITGIQRMAESLELITIAEHIEDKKTLDVLRDIGVSWGQGHFSAKPTK